jgi:hypothetical protein
MLLRKLIGQWLHNNESGRPVTPNWNAMQGFHLLMRLAHAINALSEFSKKLKKWIKEQGCAAILKVIKETIFNPWLPKKWYEQQYKKSVQLKLQLE